MIYTDRTNKAVLEIPKFGDVQTASYCRSSNDGSCTGLKNPGSPFDPEGWHRKEWNMTATRYEMNDPNIPINLDDYNLLDQDNQPYVGVEIDEEEQVSFIREDGDYEIPIELAVDVMEILEEEAEKSGLGLNEFLNKVVMEAVKEAIEKEENEQERNSAKAGTDSSESGASSV